MSFFESHDSVFDTYVMGNSPVKRLASGFDWVEGPIWFGDGGYLLLSDIPNNRIMRWTPDERSRTPSGDGDQGTISTFRQPSNYTNGHTRDRQGRLVSCEHGGRRVSRTEYDGSITVLADNFGGKPLNSPNDVVVARDGGVWFSDPHYGIKTNYEGYKSEQELPCQVYRIDPDGGIEAMVSDMVCPNGLAFSPDESLLYVADTGAMFHADAARHIRVYDMESGKPVNGRHFHTVDPGCADGFRLDTDGNIWTSAADGVHCISPTGKLLGKILVPELVSNVCWGGRSKHQLFMTATTSIYTIRLNREGV